jgi:leucyl aminopeptidase
MISLETSQQRKPADVVVLPFWQGKGKPTLACAGKEFDSCFKQPIQSGDFQGKLGETLLLYKPSGKEKRVLLLGLGSHKPCLPDHLRRSYAHAVKALRAKRMESAHFFLPLLDGLPTDLAAQAVFEGVLLANYSFDLLKGEVDEERSCPQLTRIAFIAADRSASALLKKTETVISSVNFARDLINGNADDVHVGALTGFALALAKQFSTVKTTVLGRKELEQENLRLLLAVNRGASRDPALIILEYRGNPKSKDKTAVVGKGITYDTGGLNIKPITGMLTMKDDMSGAAAALGLIQAAAGLKLKQNIVAVLPVAENAVGPNSYKPGDVIRSRSGKTVEVTDTDAEGRLVLADAFSYVQDKYKPTRLIDLATLTGGIVVALGEAASGVFSNDEGLAGALLKSGERTHERLWRMPLFPEYKELIKSSIADLKNASGSRAASPCTAATFLHQFIHQNTLWAHLDIAGTAYLSETKPYHPTLATGFGIRLLVDFFEHHNGPLA